MEETQSGKNLIAIGEKRGEKKGRTGFLFVYLESKSGMLPEELRKAITRLSTENANQLVAYLPHCKLLEDVQAWLGGDFSQGHVC